MELKDGRDLTDEKALDYVNRACRINNLNYIAVFLWGIALMFGVLAIMTLSFAIRGEKVTTNLIGSALFFCVAIAHVLVGMKARKKAEEQARAVRRGEFQYRIATLTGKHYGSETIGGKSNQLYLLVFQNPEMPREIEEVRVSRELYDEAVVGKDMYLAYLQGRTGALAVKIHD